MALVTYYLVIIVAAAWVFATRDLNVKEIAFAGFIVILAAALPMEKHAGRLRLKRVAWQATHDPLTGLLNRSRFLSQLSEQLRKRRHRASLALVILDLDRFKTINDTLGHAAGDKLLREVGARLNDLASSNMLVARLGGDEFAILMEVANKEEMALLGREVVEALNFRTVVSSQPVWVNASAGLVMATIPRPTLEELMSKADIALYQAKALGRNRSQIFEPHQPVPTISQLSMDYELRLAVERDQLSLVYQPVMDHRTGKVEGFEALCRWNHPSFGLVSPDVFIPIAEENGWILEIGKWVLERACEQASNWQRLFGGDLSMSINLSALEFARPEIVSEIKEVLKATAVQPESIHLEITETALSMDEATTLSNILELREVGAAISVDDFGVAYSSLNYLRKYPADYLKIDKSFVDEIEDKRSFGVIRAAIDVGHTLDMKVIAEGVESNDQLERLVSAGCDFAQGYLFHKPLSVKGASNLLIDQMQAGDELRHTA